ncbi:hypothetical protein GCM10023322_02050 [Rugosimonospora acidiphila]|uniref:Uncharacterized protein n=1 Tax=Rugosimonospora acidiphila TaxID=556531 RepID=A0ABP9RHD1_9ACTN
MGGLNSAGSGRRRPPRGRGGDPRRAGQAAQGQGRGPAAQGAGQGRGQGARGSGRGPQGGGRSGGQGSKGGGRPQAAGPWRATGPDARLVDLLGQVIFGLVVGLAALAAIDGIFALIQLGTFGHASGWLIAILPVWLFAEEFRAWPGVGLRIVVAVVAAAIGLVLGSVVGGLADFLPPLGVGDIGAAVATLSYTLLWFFGVRWLAHR